MAPALRYFVSRAFSPVLFAALVALPGVHALKTASAQDVTDEKRAELRDIQSALDKTRANKEALEATISSLMDDRASVNQQMIDTATVIQDREEQITTLEERLRVLSVQESALKVQLDAQRGVLSELLAALQRMGRNPPPALLVHPDDALSAIRSAIVLGAVVPQVRGDAERLIADLSTLVAVRRDIEDNRNRMADETERLVAEQARLALLVEVKRRQIEDDRYEVVTLDERLKDLANDAETVEDLIAGLEQEIARFREADVAREQAAADAAEAGGIDPSTSAGSYFAALAARKEAERLETERLARIAEDEAARDQAPQSGEQDVSGEPQMAALGDPTVDVDDVTPPETERVDG
ncbi:MAG: hypothetical protein AAF638_01515, partial [Pseudomonadota bacterium]